MRTKEKKNKNSKSKENTHTKMEIIMKTHPSPFEGRLFKKKQRNQ